MKVSIVLVSYRTPLSTIRCVSLCRHFLPGTRVLVVDNNPDEPCYQAERELLKLSQVNVLVPNEIGCAHGQALDEAVAYLAKDQIEVMVHIEPDCIFHGRIWYDNLLQGLEKDKWMAGSCVHGVNEPRFRGRIHPTPSAWRLANLNTSFNCVWYDRSASNPGWDTGHLAWRTAHLAKKDIVVKTPDFVHLWGGSSQRENQSVEKYLI